MSDVKVVLEQYRQFFFYLESNPSLVTKGVFPEAWVLDFVAASEAERDEVDEGEGEDITGEILLEMLQEEVDAEAQDDPPVPDDSDDPLEINDFDDLGNDEDNPLDVL